MKGLNFKHNFVFFNSNYSQRGIIDTKEYNAICLRDLEKLDCCQVVATPCHYAPRFFRWICQIFLKKNWLFKEFWYPFIFKLKKFKQNKPICFIIGCNNLPITYLEYLKTRYPNCKLVKIHRDLVKISHQYGYSEEIMQKLFDLRMTYDQNEAKELGLPYFHEIGSKIPIPISKDYPICDVFFAGQAKNRLNKILEAYEKFTNAGLKCDFYITNVPLQEQIPKKGITYGSKFMSYYEMLYKAVNARCLLDINQEGAVGFTSRFLEAIMYNKKLVIDNPIVKESKYYNAKFIQYVKTMKDINPNFVLEPEEVKYNYQGEFSPIYLIEQIESELTQKQNIKC